MRSQIVVQVCLLALGLAACGRLRFATDHDAATSMDASIPTARCGDGVVEGAEQCDDANLVAGDGCQPTCRFGCVLASDCDDGATCNGTETCTAAHVCRAGAPLSDGTVCGAAGAACRAGACAAVGCGNGTPDPGEECDDGNVLPGDGCEPDCTFTCELASECPDPNPCDGVSSCVSNVCQNGVAPLDGTACGDGVCRARVCVLDLADAGTAAADAGPTDIDATSPSDAGAMRVDAGSVPAPDAGPVLLPDAGSVPALDAGPMLVPDAGPDPLSCSDPLTSGDPLACFSRCEFDSDCVYVSDNCCCSCTMGGAATPINTAYQLLWSARLGCGPRTCMGVLCPDVYVCPSGPPVCIAGQCLGGGGGGA